MREVLDEREIERKNDRRPTGEGPFWADIGTIVIAVVAAVLLVPLFIVAMVGTAIMSTVVFFVVIPLAAFFTWIFFKVRGKMGDRRVTEVVADEELEAAPLADEDTSRHAVMAFELETIDIFREMTDAQAGRLAALARREFFEPGTVLADRSQHGDKIYAILDGQIELHSHSYAGEITVRVAGAGESLPLAALIGDGELITSARAMTTVEAAVVPAEALRTLCVEDPDIGRKMYCAIAEILGERYRHMLERLSSTFQEALTRADLWANV